MPNYFRKLFPANGSTSFLSTFKVLILAEGYTQSMESQFYKDVANLWFRLTKYHPFSTESSAITFYSLFKSSNQQGYATSQGQASGRTALESYYDSSAQKLFLNNTITDNILDDSIVQEDGNLYNVNKYLYKEIQSLSLNTLVLILLPANNISTAEDEVVSSSNYYKIATTADNNYEQVLIRAIAKLVGLADEYELDGSQFEAPSSDLAKFYNSNYPNIIYLDNNNSPNPSSNTDFKWRVLFQSSYNQQLPIHVHPGNIATADRSLPTQPMNYDKIELWEGAAGYRTKLYRSAFDCLLRRKIGDSTLPVKQKKIDLCPICSIILNNFIGS